MPVIAGVALGGALGASTRYLLDRAIEARSFAVFPWATFTINITGCFLIGVISASLVDRHHLPAWLRIGLVMGVIGGYTTFSTFAQEGLELIDARDLLVALAYLGGSVLFGIVAVYVGQQAGRAL
jgi:fluoride exporter